MIMKDGRTVVRNDFFFLNKTLAVARSVVGSESCLYVTPIRLELPLTANQIALSEGASVICETICARLENGHSSFFY